MDREDLEYINQNMLGCSEDMSESFNNEITDKIINTLKSLGYDCYSKDIGWEDEKGNPVEFDVDQEEPEDGWWYNTIPYYLCKNNANQVSFSWRIDEADKTFTIEGLYANYKESVKGFATKTLEELFKIIPSGWNIHINWNQNAGYWNHMKEKHSEYTWKDVSESLDLSEAYFSDSEKEIYMTDEMYKLKNMFNNSSASFRCVYDFSENFVGFCELDLEIHDTLERTMYKYADHMPKFGRFIEFSKKFYDKNSLDDEIDYYNIELVQYEYENFFIVWLEEDSSFRDTELFKALGEPINTLKYIKESKNLKEDEPWNISHRGYTNFYDGSKASALEKISNYVGYTVTEDDLDYLKEVAEADDDEELLGYIEYYYKANESLNETINKSFIEYCKDRNIKFKNEEGVLTFDSFRDMLKCIQLLMDMHIPYKQDNKSVIVDKKYLEEKLDRYLYRGEDNSRNKLFGENAIGLYFSTTEKEAKEFTRDEEPVKYKLKDDAKIYECKNSLTYMIKNKLENVKDEKLSNLLKDVFKYESDDKYPYNIKSWNEWVLAMKEEGLDEEDFMGEPYFEYWFIPQYFTYKDLKSKGYDGVKYLEEDSYSPIQYQIWNTDCVEKIGDESLEEKIVKKGSKYQVQSEKGRNMGTYDTKAEAEKRLGQIEYFKHMNEDVSRQEVISDVEHALGTTDENVEGPSYILPNGKFLKIWNADIDINGMSGGQSRSGKAQHLDVDGYIRKKYPESKIGMWGRYLEKDCIRVNSGFEEYVVLPKQRPNDTQLDSLMKWLDTYFLDHEKIEVIPPDYKWSNRKEYYGTEIISDEIIKKIKKYYGTGVLDEDKSSHLEIKTSFEDIDKYLHEHYTFSNHIDENNSSQLIDKEGRFFNSGKYEYYHGNLLNELIDAGLISVGEGRLDQYNYINTTLFGDIGYVRCNDSEGDYIQLPENITEAQINAISKWIDERYLGHGYTVIDVGCESLKTFVRYMFEYDESHQADDFMKMIRRFKNSHTLVEDIKQTSDRFDTIVKTEKDNLNRFLDKYDFELEIITDDDAVDWYNPYTMNSVGMFVGDVQDNASVFPVALNKELILKLCKEEDIDLLDAIKGTLWHEAGHGIYRYLQDTHDMPEDEEECVEEFAREVENSELYDILEKSMTESLKESSEYTTTVYTYQSPDVLKQLKSGKTYIAEYGKGMFSDYDEDDGVKNPYRELARVLNLKNCPIFGAIDEDELWDMIVASGLETSDRTQLLKLEVPSSEVHKMSFYDWTDYIYFWIDEQEEDSITQEEADDSLRHYSGQKPCQVVIDRIEPEWLVSDEDVTAENPFSKEEIEKDLDDIHNWFASKQNEDLKSNNDQIAFKESLTESNADTAKFYDWAGKDLADRFMKFKSRMKNKDIYYWMKRDKSELEKELDILSNTKTNKEIRATAKEGAVIIAEDDNWTAYRIDSYDSAKYYGYGTQWCISSANNASNIITVDYAENEEQAIEYAKEEHPEIINVLNVYDEGGNMYSIECELEPSYYYNQYSDNSNIYFFIAKRENRECFNDALWCKVAYVSELDLYYNTDDEELDEDDLPNTLKDFISNRKNLFESVEKMCADKDSDDYNDLFVCDTEEELYKEIVNSRLEELKIIYKKDKYFVGSSFNYTHADILKKAREYGFITREEEVHDLDDISFIVTKIKDFKDEDMDDYYASDGYVASIDYYKFKVIVRDVERFEECPFFKYLESGKSINESKADIQKFRDYVGDELADKFFRLKDRLQGNAKDIYYWMSLEKQVNDKQNVLLALEDYLDEIDREPTRSQVRRLAEQGAEKVYEDSRWLVLKINTYEASVKYGKDTKWCVTGNNSEQGRIDFERHTADASLYFYIDKQRKKNKYALEYQDADNWCLFDSEDWPEVGYGNQFNNALDVSGGTCWSPYDTDRYPALPHVNGLPDLQQAYKDAIANISEDSLDANDFIAEKLHKTERFDMFETNSAYDAKNYLVNSKESLRVFIDEHTDEYLICKVYEATHSDMIDYANSELALDTYIDDYDNKKICLIYVPNSDHGFDEQSDAYDDDYDMCYEYNTFRIYSRYINFRNFELYKILGKVKNVKRMRL